MDTVQQEIGQRIRMFRKSRKMTIHELAERVYKSKSVISKYELGETNLDIATLYDIAAALEIDPRQLLSAGRDVRRSSSPRYGIFCNQQLYLYMLAKDRGRRFIRGLLSFYDTPDSTTSATFYMNIADFTNYHRCTSIHLGTLECYPTNAVIRLISHSDPSDHTTIYAGLHMNSPSACYGMLMQSGDNNGDPGALKIILSTAPLPETPYLEKCLSIKEDLPHCRRTNIFGYQWGVIPPAPTEMQKR